MQNNATNFLADNCFLEFSVKVDFGCGSGSLLDSLMEHTTSLEKIVGVDISRKSLTRAAKVVACACFGVRSGDSDRTSSEQ
ncbi:Small RNA 2'-O-methyltransferase [Ananas comosus]|uniref:Small RNA 2'-O-methyltransferase n=1 Tax=Ananas comosus TaxID=4615 RepID=A0A199UJI0_ANACO|nr:Small RNA 2'-O-methyltransferase [Ananas comosus]